MLYIVLYVCGICLVVCGCAVSRRYIDVCYCDMFSVVNVYLDHLKFVLCVLMVEGMSVVVNVMVSLMSVKSPPHVLCNLSVHTVVSEVMHFGCFSLRGGPSFLNCDDICMGVGNNNSLSSLSLF